MTPTLPFFFQDDTLCSAKVLQDIKLDPYFKLKRSRR